MSLVTFMIDSTHSMQRCTQLGASKVLLHGIATMYNNHTILVSVAGSYAETNRNHMGTCICLQVDCHNLMIGMWHGLC